MDVAGYSKRPLKTKVSHLKQWRIFRVFSEHLKMNKKCKNSILGHLSAINGRNCLYLYRCLSQRICFLTRSNDYYLSAQAWLQVVQ